MYMYALYSITCTYMYMYTVHVCTLYMYFLLVIMSTVHVHCTFRVYYYGKELIIRFWIRPVK